PLPTATPPPRPNVGVQTAPSSASGSLRVTLTARDAGCPANNQLHALRFTRLANATVDVPGVGRISAPTAAPIALPDRPSSVTLTVGRVESGQTTTVEAIVTDGCGDWPTFLGAGPTAF